MQLTCTVGLPRSGKSSWAKDQGVPVVCPDAIRMALHGGAYRSEAEPMVWAVAKLMVRSLFLAGHDRVILDATNTTRARRDEWLDGMWTTRLAVFPATEQVCAIRALEAGRLDLMPAIHRMAKQFEPLTEAEMERADVWGD